MRLAARIALYGVQGICSLFGGFLTLFVLFALMPGSGFFFFSSTELIVAVSVFLLSVVGVVVTYRILHGSLILAIAPGVAGFVISLGLIFLLALFAGCVGEC